MSVNIVAAKNVTFDYPNCRALVDVSFDIEEGASIALVGPNGSGKSTLMRLIAALGRPLFGTITVSEFDTVLLPKQIHAIVGYLPDRIGLFEDLTVHKSLCYSAQLRNIAGNQVEFRVSEVASELNLSKLVNRYPSQLSRGERQRLAIAQSIIHNPKLLLLDEPMANLDPEARSELSHYLRKVTKTGVTTVVSSHILSELQEYASTMIVIKSGKVLDQQNISSSNNSSELKVEMVFTLVDTPSDLAIFSQHGFCDLRLDTSTLTATFTGTGKERAMAISEIAKSGIWFEEVKTLNKNLTSIYLESVKSRVKSDEN